MLYSTDTEDFLLRFCDYHACFAGMSLPSAIKHLILVQPKNYLDKAAFTQILLSHLKQCNSTRPIQQIHAQMLLHSISNNSNFLLPKLIHLKDFSYSLLVFSHLLHPSSYAFNIFIRGLTTTWEKFDLAIEFYYKMKASGLKPDNFTYPFVFIACWKLLALPHGRLAHCGVVKSGLCVDYHVTNSLITMYARCGEIGLARRVFDEMSNRDTVSWNSMISGYSRMNFAEDALKLFGNMMDDGFAPDEMTLVTALGSCGELGDLEVGRWIERYVGDDKMELNSYIGSALIDMYGKCGDLQSASRIFYNVPKKDVVTWNAMITAYAQNGFSEEAISFFSAMEVSGINPDKITVIGALSSCASIGSLNSGKHIDEYASQRGLKHDIYVATALIDMYSKCGSIDLAFQVFEDMPKRNEVTWNAMISALALHGQAHEALLLFERMLQESGAALPNDVTFVGVLSACVHGGLVDEGRRLYDLMISSFRLVPKIEHNSCMVDLFSRAGRVYEAWDFIEKMPQKPDEVLLGALLSACHKLKNVDVGERVIRLLLDMEPSNSGNYVVSSKIYANESRWDDSARLRVLMRQRGVMKTPGCSWIEMGSLLLEFHAGDFLPECSEGIYQMLKILYAEMKMEEHEKDLPQAQEHGLIEVRLLDEDVF